MTQLDKAMAAMKELAELPIAKIRTRIDAPFLKLEDALAAAANRPPLGESDGSISEEQWTEFQNFKKSIIQAHYLYLSLTTVHDSNRKP